MLQELFDSLGKQAVKAAGVRVFHPKCEPAHRYIALGTDGAIKWQDADPSPRNHVAGDVAGIIELANKFADGSVVVWYNRKAITILVDDKTRRDKITLPLEFSPQLAYLQAIENSPTVRPLSQSEIIKLLRTLFFHCTGHIGDLLTVIRGVRFVTNKSTSSEQRQGKESMGKSIESELTGADKVPETIQLEVPIFKAGALNYVQLVACDLAVDLATEKFLLTPIPGDIEVAITAAEREIGKRLSDELSQNTETDIPVHYGQP